MKRKEIILLAMFATLLLALILFGLPAFVDVVCTGPRHAVCFPTGG